MKAAWPAADAAVDAAAISQFDQLKELVRVSGMPGQSTDWSKREGGGCGGESG